MFTPTDNTIMKAELAIYETFADAGIPHYTGADSFALNGAFLGYGVDYANLGRETADMIASILTEGKDPATTPVITFDNGTATVNTEICEKLGLDFVIVGVGGVIRPDDYKAYREAGANAVMSATGAMWDANLAREIKETLR